MNGVSSKGIVPTSGQYGSVIIFGLMLLTAEAQSDVFLLL